MPTIETKRNLAAAALFMLPVVLVKLAAFIHGSPSPAHVQATAQPVRPAAGIEQALSRTTPSPLQLAAAEHIASLHDQPFGPTPFYYEPRAAKPVVQAPPSNGPPSPQLSVQAIMVTGAGDIVLIDGKPHQVGDPLGDSGWRIIQVDGDSRSVTIEDPKNNRTQTYFVQIGR